MAVREKKKKKITFRSVSNWLHLWLGLISGIILVIVCFTACLWVFHYEITSLLIPKKENKYIVAGYQSLLPPSKIIAIADSLYPQDFVRGITYTKDHPISFTINIKGADTSKKPEPVINLIHPYTGEYLGLKTEDSSDEAQLRKRLESFFGWAISGHRFLWLPRDIGRPIVNYATLLFSITLITGLIWWYPKKWTKSVRDKSFKVKWKAGWKRLNLDLHNVFGFYSFLLALLLAITGMYYGITWFNKALYWSTNWGETLAERKPVKSDTTKVYALAHFPLAFDKQVATILTQYKDPFYLNINYPDTSKADGTIQVYIRNDMDRQFNNRYYSFDQYTAEFLPNSVSLFNKDYNELSPGEKFRRLNYDIHVGSIWGLPTKILAFFVTFIAGSLPITGFIIWYNRKWGKKKKKGTKKETALSRSVSEPITAAESFEYEKTYS
jgi:uncharacterized iron-regulated membrane protein